MIRLAERTDVPEILAIYAPYVRDTAISFEYEVPSLEAFQARFDAIVQKYPWLVWEENGRVLGYAYADVAFSRAAYQWDADMSIYLDASVRGQGIGTRLYDCLETLMAQLGYHNLYAIITGENQASCQFHEQRGYMLLGRLEKTGFKHERWHDVCWYGLRLCPAEIPSERPKTFKDSLEAQALLRRFSTQKNPMMTKNK